MKSVEMDGKAAMRSRMKEAAQKRGKRIDSPVVRYNDLGQPVCKVCNMTVKSEALWTAHSASRLHKAAVDDFKARAAAISGAKSSEPLRANVDLGVVGNRPASALPDNFFDKRETKRANAGSEVKSSKPVLAQNVEQPRSISASEIQNSGQPTNVKSSSQTVTQAGKQIPAAKGSLPEGFFDNQDADSRARGVEPVKLDIKDEYKEFQKSIKEDVQEVDVRLAEEEFEAAEEREEREHMLQRNLMEQIELFKKRQEEKTLAAAKVKANLSKFDEVTDEESSDESDEEDNLFVDWRAKHL